MPISDKTRKSLWGRSGNRCAMCRIELVAEVNEHDKNLNLGDECHIISAQLNGPRHDSTAAKDYDAYENLILLCKNHHRVVDELWETYTTDLLRNIKSNHEKWIAAVIEKAKNGEHGDDIKLMPRILEGKELVRIIHEVGGYRFDHCEFNSQEEADYISGFFQKVQDWSDIASMESFEIGAQIQFGYDLTNDLRELERRGFFLFGERRIEKMFDRKNSDVWDVAVLVVLRKNDTSILTSEKLFEQTSAQ